MPLNVPLIPEVPLVPEVPEVPLVPLVPLVPGSPLSPVRAKVSIQSSPLENGLAVDSSTGLTTTLKYPVCSDTALLIANIIKAELSYNLLTFTCPLIVDVESSIVRK